MLQNKSTKNKSKKDEEKQSLRELADEIYHNVFGGNLLYFEGSFYIYAGGYWRKQDNFRTVQKVVMQECKSLSHTAATQIAEMLSILHEVDEMKSPAGMQHNLLAFQNGTLDLATMELINHDPAHNLRTGFDFDWKPEAGYQLWLNTLADIFEYDEDAEQRMDFVQEFFGYCLTEDVSQHAFLWLVGKGSNGKSLILKVLTAMLGERNVSNAKLERLSHTFARAQLQGKLVNISAEMSANATVADGYLKEIVSGDRIEAEHKNRPPFSFTPVVKLVCATNALPRLLDVSDGFFRRAIILELTRQFSEDDRTIDLDVQIVESELPGIVAWAVEGLNRMRLRGKFDVPPSAKLVAEGYRKESDHVLSFVLDYCSPDERGSLPSDLFEAYRDYARANNFTHFNINTFGKRLAGAGVEKRHSNGHEYWKLLPNMTKRIELDAKEIAKIKGDRAVAEEEFFQRQK